MTQRYLLITIGVLFVLNTGEVCAACAPPPVRQWQDNPSVQFPAPAFRSQQIVPPISRYEGRVYMPFSSAAPSASSPAASTTAPANKKRPGAMRNGFINGPEGPSGPSPVGEPWVLGVLAMMMVGWRAIKRRKGIVIQ